MKCKALHTNGFEYECCDSICNASQSHPYRRTPQMSNCDARCEESKMWLTLPNAGATLTTRINKMMLDVFGISCLLFFSLILSNIFACYFVGCFSLCSVFFVLFQKISYLKMCARWILSASQWNTCGIQCIWCFDSSTHDVSSWNIREMLSNNHFFFVYHEQKVHENERHQSYMISLLQLLFNSSNWVACHAYRLFKQANSDNNKSRHHLLKWCDFYYCEIMDDGIKRNFQMVKYIEVALFFVCK